MNRETPTSNGSVRIELAGYVTASKLEEALVDAGLDYELGADSVWRPTGAEGAQAVCVDMTHAKSIQFTSLAPLIVFLSSLLEFGIPLQMMLPRKPSARKTLANSDFLRALQYRPEVSKLLTVEGEPLWHATSFSRMFPFKWVTDQESLRQWLTAVLRSQEDGRGTRLDWGTAIEFTNYIIDELIENVQLHSLTERALIGVIANSKEAAASSAQFLRSERHVFTASRVRAIAGIEIVVADAGRGVERALSERYSQLSGSALLAHAYDRWSSSTDDSIDRGTRGLYRVALLANRLNGFVTLRSGGWAATKSRIAQYRRGSPVEANHDINFPGTCLRINLPLSMPTNPVLATDPDQVEPIKVVTLPSGEPTKKTLRRASYRKEGDRAVRVIDAGRAELTVRRMQQFLIDAAEICHPGPTAIVGLQCNDAELLAAADGANQKLDALSNSLKINWGHYEPVMVSGSRFSESYWVGAPPDVATLLQDERDVDGTVASQIAANLLYEDSAGNSRLRLSGAVLERSTSRYLEESARSNTIEPSRGNFITPSLSLVKGWLDVSKLLGAPGNRELASRLLVSKLATAHPAVFNARPHVVYEDGLDTEFAVLTSNLLSGHAASVTSHPVSQHDVESARPLVLAHRPPVVVLLSAISEGLTARQIVAYCLRQGVNVLAITSVVDTRSERDSIALWERRYPCVSAFSIDLDPSIHGPIAPVDRSGRAQTQTTLSRTPIPTRDAIEKLSMCKSLRLGHISSGHDNHFTFFIDPRAVFDCPAAMKFFARPALQAIDRLAHEGRVPYMISGIDESRTDNPALEFARYLSEQGLSLRGPRLASTIGPRAAKRGTQESPMVLVAWGALSGQSIFKEINRLGSLGASHIEIIIVFSQMNPVIEQHLMSLRSLKLTEVDLRIRTTIVSRIPVAAYDEARCPVCTQGRRGQLGSNRSPSWQDDRFELASWRTGLYAESGDALSDVYGTSAHDVVTEALMQRAALVASERSIIRALEVKKSWETRTDEQLVLGLATLLIYEPIWLPGSRKSRSLGL